MATTKKKVLGKGLGSLIPGAKSSNTVQPTGNTPMTEPEKNADSITEININHIEPNRYQPRKDFDEASLEDLRISIKQYGVIQPLIVRTIGNNKYELIAGERRLRASKLAGLETVPVVIRQSDNAEMSELALIENIQRENLNAIEEARAYERLMTEFKLTQDSLSHKIGRSRSHIANFLRLLKLSPKIQNYLANSSLSMGQAKPLLSLDKIKLQEEAAEYILQHELSARDAERLVKKLIANPNLLHSEKAKETKKTPKPDVHVRAVEDRLVKALGTKVKIKEGSRKSLLEIEFYTPEELERIIAIIENNSNRDKEDKLAALRSYSTKGFTV